MPIFDVHLYVDSDDAVSADARFLALTATEDGVKRVSLPNPTTVRDLLDGRILGENVTSLDMPMKRGETRLLILNSNP